MYVESKVPKDLKKYKNKIGGFTVRQIFCIAIAIALDIILWSVIFIYIDIEINYKIYLTVFCDIPVMAFILEPSGMKMEKYIKNVLIKSLLYPRYRYSKNKHSTNEYKVTKKQIKQRKKEIPKLIREHPELKAYR